MPETSNSLPEWALQLLKSYAQGERCVCDLAINTLNRLELALQDSGVNFTTPGFNPGVLTRQYSRDSVLRFPDTNVRYVKYPDLFRREILSADSSLDPQLRTKYLDRVRALVPRDNLYTAPDAAIRKAHLAFIRELLGDDWTRIKNGYVKRLIDRPEVNEQLIRFHIEHQTEKLTTLLRGGDYEFGKQRYDFTRNRARHFQKATLDSYISRAFGSDDLSAIRLKQWAKWDADFLIKMIETLPIDPEKISDETLEKLWLTPEDFSSYTPGARNRYKLAIREKFLWLFARAKPVNRRGEWATTARILTVPHVVEGERIAIFRTVTDSHIHTTWQRNPRRRFHKVSRVLCSIFETREEAMRSQGHALGSIYEKLDEYIFLGDAFGHYNRIVDEDTKKTLIAEALEICGKQKSFYDSKLTLLFIQLFDAPNNALILRHIVMTLSQAQNDLTWKQTEIRQVHDILSQSSEEK